MCVCHVWVCVYYVSMWCMYVCMYVCVCMCVCVYVCGCVGVGMPLYSVYMHVCRAEAAEPGGGALGARAPPPPTFLPRVWSALPALGYMLGLQCIWKECPEGQ